MKINSSNFAYNPNFQKKLVAQGSVLKSGKPEEVFFYLLDKVDDEKDLIKASKKELWKDDYYLKNSLIKFWHFLQEELDIFTMENKKGDIICYGVIDNDRKKEARVKFIETAPSLSSYNRGKREFKYVGETMLSYLALQSGKKDFVINHVADRVPTQNFYKKCGFKPYKTHDAIMSSAQVKKFIKNNEVHTGQKIKIVG